ncbi:hypothetical protein BU17DRAFT_93664 [Hysterangium stoloniferum]|nr:hypothetical protein BU17DRAFT_93664 [Hysterangium stoloniferum]
MPRYDPSDSDEETYTHYGPFLDEEFFFYGDTKSTIELDSLELHHITDGFVGFDDLEMIYYKGKDGNLEDVFFSGIATISKVDSLCEKGYMDLLKAVRERDATVTFAKLNMYCKDGKIQVELHCQLKMMPHSYSSGSATKFPGAVVLYSKNMNNLNAQRQYVVSSFHANCFRRSEGFLQRYMVVGFVGDVCSRFRSTVPRKDRDVHWLVNVYMEDYNELFGRTRPRLHRSEVYDHFAVHSEWLSRVFYPKKDWLDRNKWIKWQETVKVSREKAIKAKKTWGVPIVRPKALRNPRTKPIVHRSLDGNIYVPPSYDLESDSDSPEPPPSEAESSDGDEKYTWDPALRPPSIRGLFNPMPVPSWYWTCDITPRCQFVIDLGYQRDMGAPCMAPLTAKEKAYLQGTAWGLYDHKLGKIWSKICQNHMDWHWREAGIVVDHRNKRLYALEEENMEVVSDEDHSHDA